MSILNSLWYVGAGFLLGWIVSTLVEWLWFRRRRLQGSAYRTRADREQTSVATPQSPAPETDESWDDASGTLYRPYRVQEERDERDVMQPTTSESSPSTDVALTDGEPRPQRVSVARQPSPPRQARPDPLAAIRGIGEVYQKRLYQAGIYTWHQLANSDPATLRSVTRAQASSNPESWIEQAHQLAREHNRENAIYAGPTPDDLTRIDGIGPVYEQELYQAGIVTFAQLAQLTPHELAAVLPETNVVGEELDYRSWIDQAARLSHA